MVRKKEMEKLDDSTVRDHWIIYLFHFYFIFPHQSLIQTQPKRCRNLNFSSGHIFHDNTNQGREIFYKMLGAKFTQLFNAAVRLDLDQGFGERKGNRKVRRSNYPGPLDPLPFPFLCHFSSPNS